MSGKAKWSPEVVEFEEFLEVREVIEVREDDERIIIKL